MAVFSKTSSVHSPTRASGRGGNTKKQKDHLSIGAIHPFSSFSLQKLRKRQSALGSRYQSTGISKHYDANHQIYEAFQFHYYNLSSVVVADSSNPNRNNTNRNNTNRSQSQPHPQETRNNSTAKSNLEWISCAFCLGWNFVETALLELPGHGCFYSNQDPNLVKLRKRSSLAALEVTRLLQRILKLMDSLDMGKVPEETMLLQNNDHHHDNHDPNAAWLLQINRRECNCRLETLKYLAKEQQCEERLDAYEATRKSILSKWRNINNNNDSNNSNNNDGGAFVPSRFELDSECNDDDDDDRSAENGATTSLRFMVGNHRGGRLSPPQPPSYDDQDEASHRRSANPGMDCDTVGETFLSCSRLFCPSALPERTGSYTIPLRATRTATLPSSALMDEDQDCDCNDDDDDDSDNRSDSAVFHSVSNSGPFGRSNNNSSYNTDGLLILQNNNSDDAVFESPIKSHDSQGSLISPPEATTIPTPTRNETEDSSIDSSSRISRRNLKKLKKKNRSKNKKKNNGDETPTKKANKSYPTWLFGKKANVLQHQRRTHEDTDLEEALYQSQLEAAKAASMREEDLIGDLIHGNNNNNSNSYSFDQQRELTSSFSSWSATGHPEVVAAAPQTIQATTDAQHDYDLKRALYLSELQIDESTTTRYQHHDVGTSWNPPLHQRSFEADSGCEREKRDDSAREGPASSIPLSIRQEAVTKGTTVGAPTAVVVKGSPVAPVVVKGSPVAMVPPPPPGAIRRRRNDTDPYSLLRVLRACCRKDFERLRDNKNVVVTWVSTYQGRIKGSTNGCTVIAPLLCVHHFQTRNHLLQNKNVGVESPPPPPSRRLSDGTIASVIDTESPLLLPDIRNSLGVSKNAFLIPHDAHEALIESKHMSRDQFVTVCGGNILEEGHLGALVRELSKVLPDGKKLGATFFFHQHVIAILQLRNGNSASQTDSGKKGTNTHASTTLSFDVIDSLPNKATLPLPPISSSPVSSDAHPRPPNCARIFCKDAASLEATLKWYACSVFTSANERYIDDYEWDEKLTDFDPRVFQAFLWKEA